MVYLDKNSTKVLFPRVSFKEITLITFTNQITKEIFDCSVTDRTNNNNYYTVDLSRFLDHFTVGQYDYTLYSDKVAVGTGILQFGEYNTDINNGYNADIDVIQYDADNPYTPLPDRVLKITENGTYDVDHYNKASVNVKSGGAVSSFSLADIITKAVGFNPDEDGYYTQYTNLIYLTFTGDVWANKDLYVGVSRYKKQTTDILRNKVKSSNKYVLFRDFRKQLNTPLECYKNENNVYAYTDGTKWYMHRDPSDFTTWCDVAYNRAYCVNELVDFVGDAKTDYGLTRYADGDIYEYVNVKNTATTVDEIIAESIDERPYGTYAYRGYMQNTPIVPIKISDMKLRVNGTLTDKTLNDITKEEFDSYKSVEFLYPYPTEWVMNRIFGDTGRLNYNTTEDYFTYRCYDGDKKANFLMLKEDDYRRRLIGEDSRTKTCKHLIFNIYNEEQIYGGYPSNYAGVRKTLINYIIRDQQKVITLI